MQSVKWILIFIEDDMIKITQTPDKLRPGKTRQDKTKRGSIQTECLLVLKNIVCKVNDIYACCLLSLVNDMTDVFENYFEFKRNVYDVRRKGQMKIPPV